MSRRRRIALDLLLRMAVIALGACHRPGAGGPKVVSPDSGACASAICNGDTGLCAPLASCTPGNPCSGIAGKRYTDPAPMAVCKTSRGGRPVFDDGAPRTWIDLPTGDRRSACVFVPPAAGQSAKLPLVIFMHGAYGSAQGGYDYLSLRSKAPEFDLTGDPARRGFLLAFGQGRSIHYPNGNPEGPHHDIYFRDLASPSANPDVRYLDTLIDDLVDGGLVDPSRIYVTGWSNGAFFGQLYAVARHETPTPRGNRVAAAAVFAGGDPFNNTQGGQLPSCQLAAYPATTVPILSVLRACDAMVGCDESHRAKFGLPPGYAATEFLARLGDPNAQALFLGSDGSTAPGCAAASACGVLAGAANHIHWPDGIADGSGNDREPDMLRFLREHPLR
jgi:poly(3-hydroxybutyrate) depolymerase